MTARLNQKMKKLVFPNTNLKKAKIITGSLPKILENKELAFYDFIKPNVLHLVSLE